MLANIAAWGAHMTPAFANQNIAPQEKRRDAFVDIDEFEHAITVLRIVKATRMAARTNAAAEKRIAEMVDRMRNAGETNNSSLLVGIAEALEDWLINWVLRPENHIHTHL